MDLLKDITQGLRGDDQSASSEGQSSSGSASRTNSVRHDSASDGGTTTDSHNDDSASNDQSRTNTHVCSFCETEFDAARGACPDCDAEIVFRGER